MSRPSVIDGTKKPRIGPPGSFVAQGTCGVRTSVLKGMSLRGFAARLDATSAHATGRDRRGPPDLPADPHAFPDAAAARCESAAESRSR